MLVSTNWLRELIDGNLPDASGVARVLTSRGLTVDGVQEIAGDVVFDLDVPANRPDALGHLGVARELVAGLGLRLRPRPAPIRGTGDPVDRDVSVVVDDPEACGRYTARLVRGVSVGPSPDRVVQRLTACGLRPVNNVVDVSNLVMLETGHPNHTFDLALVAGGAIVVRGARPGEILVTLDGVERRLGPGMLVIADAKGPAAIAGIIGGAASEIRATTRDVLIEAAWFDPRSVRATARKLGVSTDASQRFERGADPDGPAAAQEMCVRLLAEICGGSPAPGLIDVRPRPPAGRSLAVRLDRVRLLLGYAPNRQEVFDALAACALAPRDTAPGVIAVDVPTWRVDLEHEADVIEEIAKHLGYDRIPEISTASAGEGAAVPTAIPPEERVRDLLDGLGFHEAFNYAMIGPGEDDPFVPPSCPAPLALTNPLAEPLSLLRRSLLPGLLRAAATNLRRGVDDVRLFEVGRVFVPRGEGAFPDERLRAAFAWSGAASPRHWTAPARDADLWDALGLAEAIVRAFRSASVVSTDPQAPAGFQPGRSASLRTDAGVVAWCGVVDSGLGRALDAPAPILAGEIDLDAVAALPDPPPRYTPLPRVPRASRDLAVVVPAGVPAAALLDRLREVPAPAPAGFDLIDRYEGPPLEAGASSLTVRVTLQPLERTLTEAEIEAYRTDLVDALGSIPGLRLRG